MRSKVVAAEMAAAAGIRPSSATACEPGGSRAPGGRGRGHALPPRPERHSSFKLWLKYAKPCAARSTVDAGAARALREGGTSLLPSGSSRSGAFDAGDAVEVVAARRPRHHRQGDLQLLRRRAAAGQGHEAAAVRELSARGEEAVHRDYFVLSCARLRHGLDTAPASVTDLCLAASGPRAAARRDRRRFKDAALQAIADALEARTPEILEANARDIEAGREAGLSAALLDRLALDEGAAGGDGRAACARSPRCPTRSARCSTAAGCPTGWMCARCACRSASSRWSTRRGRTSRSTPPRWR